MHLLAGACAVDVVSRPDIAAPLPGLGSPFPITIGPEQAVAHRGWIEARDRVLSVLLAGRGLVLLLGAPGTGKTLLLQEIARTLRADGTDVLLLPRGDLVIDAAEAELADAGAGRRRRAVLIDEADRTTEAALDHLGRLGTRAFVLAGTRDPGDEQPGGSPTAAATVVRLAALPPGEVGAFVAARLAQSGLGTDLLTEGAVAQLAEHSGGVPRVLNMLAGAALFLARAERAHRLEPAHVDQAAALRGGGEEMDTGASVAAAVLGATPCQRPEPLPAPTSSVPAPRHRRNAVLGVAAGVAAACAGIVAAWYGDHARHASPPMIAERQAPAPSVPVAASSPTPRVGPASSRGALPATPPLPSKPGALPPGAPAHVVLRYVRGSADAAAWAANLALELRAAGITVDALVPVAPPDIKPGARYFFTEDQATADAVLRAAGLAGKGTLTDAKGLNALPRPGLIELTVPPGQPQAGNRRQPSGDGRS